MIITKRITLDEKEQELFEKIQDLLNAVADEVESAEEERKIDKLKASIDDFCYEYGSDEYRADY